MALGTFLVGLGLLDSRSLSGAGIGLIVIPCRADTCNDPDAEEVLADILGRLNAAAFRRCNTASQKKTIRGSSKTVATPIEAIAASIMLTGAKHFERLEVGLRQYEVFPNAQHKGSRFCGGLEVRECCADPF